MKYWIVLGVMLFSIDNAFAGDGAKKRTRAERIEVGVERGALTEQEAADLKKAEKDIRDLKKSFKADGVMTDSEKAVLAEKKAASSSQIYKEKHDQEFVQGSKADNAIDDDHNGRVTVAEKQENRIDNGIKTGNLTQAEADALAAEQVNIEKERLNRIQDGEMTQEDRDYIAGLRDTASANIKAAKANEERVTESFAEKNAKLNAKIDKAVAEGKITAEEAADIKTKQVEFADLRRKLAKDGLTDQDIADLRAKRKEIKEKLKEAKVSK
jgi:hypothetical protein